MATAKFRYIQLSVEYLEVSLFIYNLIYQAIQVFWQTDGYSCLLATNILQVSYLVALFNILS